MLGLIVDMHQKNLGLPFQPQLLKKQKQPQNRGMLPKLLVGNKPHFILNCMTPF